MTLKKCNTCNIYKEKLYFNKNNLCKKCKIISDINEYLHFAKLANYFNINIEEIKNILTISDINPNDPNRNALGEHIRYDEVMLEWQRNNFNINSQFNNKEAIKRYLEE
jgi:hypothetical protein